MEEIKKIGTPAILEQCAEESSELTHACLKMSRKLRDESPTPMEYKDIVELVTEEIADVYLCIDLVIDALNIPAWKLLEIERQKKERWVKRINEMEKKDEQSRTEKKPEER